MLQQRDHRQVDILLGQRPPRRQLVRKPLAQGIAQRKIEKLKWFRFAITAQSELFHIVFMPQLAGDSKKKRRRLTAILHLRRVQHAQNVALSRIAEKIQFLSAQ